MDPYIDGVQKLGTKRIVKGEASFFLQPGEELENGIEKVPARAMLCDVGKHVFTPEPVVEGPVEPQANTQLHTRVVSGAYECDGCGPVHTYILYIA